MPKKNKNKDECYDVCLLVDRSCSNIELGADFGQRCNFGDVKNVSRRWCTRSIDRELILVSPHRTDILHDQKSARFCNRVCDVLWLSTLYIRRANGACIDSRDLHLKHAHAPSPFWAFFFHWPFQRLRLALFPIRREPYTKFGKLTSAEEKSIRVLVNRLCFAVPSYEHLSQQTHATPVPLQPHIQSCRL